MQFNTNWNKFDDEFFLINKKWFDLKWKEFVSFDYVNKLCVEQGKREDELSLNKILSNNSHPQEMSQVHLLLERSENIRNRKAGEYCNTPLRDHLVPMKDFLIISRSVWKGGISRWYGSYEIKRYATHSLQFSSGE